MLQLFLSDCQVSSSTYHGCKCDLRDGMHFNALRGLTQPCLTAELCKISDTKPLCLWIQALHQALYIIASL